MLELELDTTNAGSIPRIAFPAHQNLRNFKLPPLPLMPMKNDVILAGKNNKVSPEEFVDIQDMRNTKKRKSRSKKESFERHLATTTIHSPSYTRRKNTNLDEVRNEKANFTQHIRHDSTDEACQDDQHGEEIVSNRRWHEVSDKTFVDHLERDVEVQRHRDTETPGGKTRVNELKLDTDIGLSYDSGLNSIDNDSILDDDFANEEMLYRDCVFSVDGAHVVKSPAWRDKRLEE